MVEAEEGEVWPMRRGCFGSRAHPNPGRNVHVCMHGSSRNVGPGSTSSLSPPVAKKTHQYGSTLRE